MSISPRHRKWLPVVGLLAVFILSRILYDQAGIHFQAETHLGYWQFIDPALLRSDLWRSILHLHSQPPLLNLTTGLVLQFFPTTYEDAFHALYYLAGLILALSILLLGYQLRFPSWLSFLATAWFVISPATVLYEHWLTYAYPLTALLALSGVFLHQFIATEKVPWGIAFFSLLALAALTWSIFHITWFLGVIFMLLVHIPTRKKVLLAALLPTIAVTAWYGKNLFIVGEFTANSWMGMNLSRISTFRLPEKDRRQMVKSGELTKFALLPPFRNPAVYLELLPDTPTTGIPVLDNRNTSLRRRNHNHLVYVEASNFYLRDAIRTIRERPDLYLRAVMQSFYIYFHSASDFDLTQENRMKMDTLDQWWNRIFYGQWENNETSGDRLGSMSAAHFGWWILAGFLMVVIGGVRFLWPRRERGTTPATMLVSFMIYNILFISLAGNLMDIGENNRIRYTIDPFLMTCLLYLAGLGNPRRTGAAGFTQRRQED